MKSNNDIPWAQLQRYRFIEWQLLWGQQLKAKMLTHTFGVSRYQAGLDIKGYVTLCPENVRPYNPADRCYKPELNFTPRFASQNPTEFIESMNGGLPGHMPINVVPVLQRVISLGIMPAVMAAIEGRYRIETLYASASTPIGGKRVLCPISLVYVANRFHVRAFCETRGEYRDFVLSRFLHSPKVLSDESFDNLPIDGEWETEVLVKLKANPKLGLDGCDLISREYDLINNNSVKLRKALVHYYLQANLLPHNEEQRTISMEKPWAFPVIIDNWKEVSALLF